MASAVRRSTAAKFFDFAVELSFRPRFVVAKNADDLAPAALFASRGW
jgi:hypothetical protein